MIIQTVRHTFTCYCVFTFIYLYPHLFPLAPSHRILENSWRGTGLVTGTRDQTSHCHHHLPFLLHFSHLPPTCTTPAREKPLHCRTACTCFPPPCLLPVIIGAHRQTGPYSGEKENRQVGSGRRHFYIFAFCTINFAHTHTHICTKT